MSKTPVSTLQEYSVKRMWGVPDYTLVSNTSGTHINRFTYKVTCHSMSACGTASNKKEAKHIAAKEMLKLLWQTGKFVPMMETSDGAFNSLWEKTDSYYLPGSCDATFDDIFINSVGKLNEHCAIRKLKTPEYQDLGMMGPPHAPMITVVCSIGNLEVRATANSKKKAKHDAAQQMLDKLVRNTNYEKSHAIMTESARNIEDRIRKIDTLDLMIEEPSISVAESANRAKALFPKLKTYNGVKKAVSDKIVVNNYHRVLKNSYESFVRQTVRHNLNDNSYAHTSKLDVLNNITSLLGLNVEYEILSNELDNIVVVCKLNSTPVIADSGIGDTYLDARDQAITNLLDSIDIFLM